MSRYLGHFAWMGVLVAFLVGCGTGSSGAYPVTGKITIKGQPAKDVLLTFAPVGPQGEPATGVVNADGTYSLFTGIKGDAGALPGKYKVVITADLSKVNMAAAYSGAKGPPQAPASPAGKEYESAQTSPKEVEVQAQSNTINIDI
jgi:hypothetical protein